MKEKLVVTIVVEMDAANDAPAPELEEAIQRGIFEHYTGPGSPKVKRITSRLVPPDPEED
ncbi:hypothetical protein [Muricoccus nepalensis]|uniref:hypothetical protein n=1 Tax=Muricoccus nepalensis TaxID=1854500 RepID=UPI00112D4887|nr:hypothetical protein [Roseomonas nepalensis]